MQSRFQIQPEIGSKAITLDMATNRQRTALFVHEVSYVDKPIFEMHEFPEILADDGWNVIFVNLADARKFRIPKKREMIKGRALPGASIFLIRPFQFGLPFIDRVLAIFLLPLEVVLAIRKYKPEFVVNYVVPTGGLFINLICRVLRVKSMQRHIDYSPGLRSKVLWPFVALAEVLALRTADAISVHNLNLLDRVAKLTGRGNKNISLLLPPIRVEDRRKGLSECLQTGSPASFFQKNFSKVGVNAVFIGTLFPFSGVRPLVEEWTRCFGLQPKSRLHIFGSGSEGRWLTDNAAELANFGVYFYGFLDFQCLQHVLGPKVVGLVPFDLANVSSLALPNKALQYLAYGSPTISTPLTGLMRSEFASAIYFAENVRELVSKLKEFETNPAGLKSLASGSAILEEKFGYASASGRLLTALDYPGFKPNG